MINLMGNSLDAGFRLTGEGFILIAQFSYGMSTVLINIFSRKISPVVLSGTQFTMGGIILFLIGKGMGGHLGSVNAAGIGIIFYLAMVSAVAYTLWSVLLAWNDVSRVAIFGFVNPLFSVILSALVLGEVRQAFNMGSLIALFLVCVGIYVVNTKKIFISGIAVIVPRQYFSKRITGNGASSNGRRMNSNDAGAPKLISIRHCVKMLP